VPPHTDAQLIPRNSVHSGGARANIDHRDSHGARQLRGVRATAGNTVVPDLPRLPTPLTTLSALMVNQKWQSPRAVAVLRVDSKYRLPILPSALTRASPRLS
jgi:hypothetical protein